MHCSEVVVHKPHDWEQFGGIEGNFNRHCPGIRRIETWEDYEYGAEDCPHDYLISKCAGCGYEAG